MEQNESEVDKDEEDGFKEDEAEDEAHQLE